MQLKGRMHRARKIAGITPVADALKFAAKACALLIFEREHGLLLKLASPHARASAAGGKARAFLIGPVGHHKVTQKGNTRIAQGIYHFHASHNAEHAVKAPAKGLRIAV